MAWFLVCVLPLFQWRGYWLVVSRGKRGSSSVYRGANLIEKAVFWNLTCLPFSCVNNARNYV